MKQISHQSGYWSCTQCNIFFGSTKVSTLPKQCCVRMGNNCQQRDHTGSTAFFDIPCIEFYIIKSLAKMWYSICVLFWTSHSRRQLQIIILHGLCLESHWAALERLWKSGILAGRVSLRELRFQKARRKKEKPFPSKAIWHDFRGALRKRNDNISE